MSRTFFDSFIRFNISGGNISIWWVNIPNKHLPPAFSIRKQIYLNPKKDNAFNARRGVLLINTVPLFMFTILYQKIKLSPACRTKPELLLVNILYICA